ncbi:hypothetical protein [Aliiroseovarius marinus]|uniref:hypothetical protein n=1 Tax=Aliiroseovarius marinus TaxID=2500159 RepID=UPI00105E9F42|nr:hypothetical protein [Aliiroseovarius marinus]
MSYSLTLFIFGGAIIIAMVALSRYQQNAYRRYLSEHVAKTDELRQGQEKLIELSIRQAEAQERIAAALEARNAK